jgi:hypothetical protein
MPSPTFPHSSENPVLVIERISRQRAISLPTVVDLAFASFAVYFLSGLIAVGRYGTLDPAMHDRDRR